MIEEKFLNDEVFLTSSTRLATALLAQGHNLRRPPCTRQIRKDGKKIVTFIFEPASPSSDQTCSQIAQKWNKLESQDPGSNSSEALKAQLAWLRTLLTSQDPIDFCYAVSAWREIALSIVKATPRMIQIEAAGAVAFIREDATAQDRKNISQYL